MYEDFYQLRTGPFNLTPDPKFLLLTPQHNEALTHLMYGIKQRKGFICLTGEVGAGKTTLCRALLDRLDDGYRTALILNPMLTETQLVKSVLTEFGIKTKRLDRLQYLNLLNNYLLKVKADGGDAVVIIDEAQDMPDKTLEMARLLSNRETETQKLLQIVLVGQPELRDKLRQQKFRQLAQRITVRYHLNCLNRQQTEDYVRHRLDVAKINPYSHGVVEFDPGAVNEIFRYSGGTPRLINAVSDKALLAGYIDGTSTINKRLVRRAVRELREAA